MTFFSSCFRSWCLFRFFFRENLASQVLQLNGFIFSWTSRICCFNRVLVLDSKWHWAHLNGLFPSCSRSWCTFRPIFRKNLASQTVQQNAFILSWTSRICCFNYDFVLDFEWHWEHVNGLSSDESWEMTVSVSSLKPILFLKFSSTNNFSVFIDDFPWTNDRWISNTAFLSNWRKQRWQNRSCKYVAIVLKLQGNMSQ